MRVSAMSASAVITLALVAMAASGCSSTSKTAAAGGGASATGGTGAASAAAQANGGGASTDINACTLLSAAKASSLVGKSFTSAQPQTIAAGQDQCTYNTADDSDAMEVIVYQPDSGVNLQMMTTVQSGAGKVQNVSGVGDKAIVGEIELDVQTGSRFLAVEGAGGLLDNGTAKAVAVANAVIAALG
jgi:hypothetical protein